ncbi:MAG: helix-turn-helix transcriptional regulator [Gammaproteobacteria bacterium]|nr:helix-turn-helix transcriptional regulator [Gammaproteobacteria bacterium]
MSKVEAKYPPSVQRALRGLGRDIQIARKKRRLPVADFAARMGVSQGTVARLEKGEPGIGLGSVAMAFLALGELNRLANLLDVSRDDTGLMLDLDSLPQRIRRRRPAIGSKLPNGPSSGGSA